MPEPDEHLSLAHTLIPRDKTMSSWHTSPTDFARKQNKMKFRTKMKIVMKMLI